MKKADELWEKHSSPETQWTVDGKTAVYCEHALIRRLRFLAALAEYGEAVRSEARKVCNTVESVKWNMHLSGKPTTLKCSDAIKDMKLP